MATPATPLPMAPQGDRHPPLVPNGEGCLEILFDRLRSSPGVVAIEADFRSNQLTVRYQPALVTPEQLNTLADEVGAMFAQRVTACERRQSQDACEQCALRLGHVPAAEGDGFVVIVDPGRVGLARRVVPPDSAEFRRPFKPWGARMSGAEHAHHSKGRGMAILTGACLVLLIAGIVLERVGARPIVADVLYLASALVGGFYALRSSLRALGRLRFDVNLLMILAAAGAASIGYVLEAAELMFLFSLSNTLEAHTMGRTRRAIEALLKLRPSVALVVRDGREMEVAAEAVRIGELVIIRPGEAIPVDGDLVRGETLVDQSNLTGESMPVPKAIGDSVFAGTLNQQGAIEVSTTRAAGDTAIARVVALVTEAQEQKSRTEEVAEWVGRYYTLAVIIGAALMIVIPPFVLGEEFQASFYRAMTLLVVASPCALVLATPATVLSAIASAARNGVLFKGGKFIEAMGRVRAVALDKTGTLTVGRFEVTDVIAVANTTEDRILAAAAAAEMRSQHPLALAVVRAASARDLKVTPAAALTSVTGKGLVATLEDGTVEIGTRGMFESLGVAVPEAAVAHADRLRRDARTAMIVRHGNGWGVIAAADRVRPNAASVVAALKQLGVRATVMLTGDNAQTAAAIAAVTGVDEHRAELLPEQKVEAVADLESRYKAVAMVGDGVNDAPALARATVGVAMGGIGSDAAMESADVVLMSDDISGLAFAVKLSQWARRVVVQNVCIAVGVMLLLVAWVFLGTHMPLGALKLPIAVSAHEGSTVVVILNGLRLLGARRSA